jgi:hypothetical protein
MNLLAVVEFPATRIPRSMDVPNEPRVLSEPSDNVPMHDLDVIDVK